MADIYTVIESVDNWFEASSPSIALAEVPEGVVTRLEFGGTEQGPSRTAEPVANGETISQPAYSRPSQPVRWPTGLRLHIRVLSWLGWYAHVSRMT